MKLSLTLAALVALGGGIVAAQTAQPGDKVTFAGCLQRAQRDGSVGGTIVGTSAAPDTADDDANSGLMVDAFLLTEATPVVGGAAEPPSSSGGHTDDPTAAAVTGTSGRVTPTTFGLQGREAELERHPGARLQVTGTVVPPASSGRGAGGAATASGAKRIKVDSFEILAEKCGAS